MSGEKLLNVEPRDLSFTLELKKKPSCSFKLFNKTQNRIAYKVMTTSPRKFQVRPSSGILPPGSSCDVLDVRGLVQESKLGVAYILTPDAPLPVAEESTRSFSTSPTESSEMIGGELLDVHPSELRFPFEVKELLCSLRISNVTENGVGFNVKTTNPDKYSVQPYIGIVGPQSTCDITVRMQAQTEILLDMKCKDKFLIQSTVATTRNITREMFNNTTGFVDEFKLGVLYVTPSRPLYSKVIDWLGGNKSTFGGLFMKRITIGFLFLMFLYLMMKVLPLIWNLTFEIMILVVKMIKSEISDKVEDWIVKCLAMVCIHFIYVIFRCEASIYVT